MVRYVKRHFPVSDDVERRQALRPRERQAAAHPVVIVVLSLGMTDLLFALDSIPAIYGLTRSPTSCSPPTSSR